MEFAFKMDNTKLDEEAFTRAYLVRHADNGVKVVPSSGGRQYSGTVSVDTDEDVLNLLAVAAFYQDRTIEQIADLRLTVRNWMVDNPAKVS